MAGEPSRSFEILGFDLLLDTNLKPWLIEVNYSPSLRLGSPLGMRDAARTERASRVCAIIAARRSFTRHDPHLPLFVCIDFSIKRDVIKEALRVLW